MRMAAVAVRDLPSVIDAHGGGGDWRAELWRAALSRQQAALNAEPWPQAALRRSRASSGPRWHPAAVVSPRRARTVVVYGRTCPSRPEHDPMRSTDNASGASPWTGGPRAMPAAPPRMKDSTSTVGSTAWCEEFVAPAREKGLEVPPWLMAALRNAGVYTRVWDAWEKELHVPPPPPECVTDLLVLTRARSRR